MKVLYVLICVLFPAAVSILCGFAMESSYRHNVLNKTAIEGNAHYMDAFPAMAAIYLFLLILGGLTMYFRRPLYPFFAISAVLAALVFIAFKCLGR